MEGALRSRMRARELLRRNGPDAARRGLWPSSARAPSTSSGSTWSTAPSDALTCRRSRSLHARRERRASFACAMPTTARSGPVLDAGVDGVVVPRVERCRRRGASGGAPGLSARGLEGVRGQARVGLRQGSRTCVGGRSAWSRWSPRRRSTPRRRSRTVDGVDALVVGCADLALALGGDVEPSSAGFRDAVTRVQDAAESAGTVSGSLVRMTPRCWPTLPADGPRSWCSRPTCASTPAPSTRAPRSCDESWRCERPNRRGPMSAPEAWHVTRTLRAMELLAVRPRSAPELADALGVHVRTARRVLKRLDSEGYVMLSDDRRRRYRPTMRVVALAAQVVERAELPATALPARDVAARTARGGLPPVRAEPPVRAMSRARPGRGCGRLPPAHARARAVPLHGGRQGAAGLAPGVARRRARADARQVHGAHERRAGVAPPRACPNGCARVLGRGPGVRARHARRWPLRCSRAPARQWQRSLWWRRVERLQADRYSELGAAVMSAAAALSAELGYAPAVAA